jgi:CheY-like chemotaxis protein
MQKDQVLAGLRILVVEDEPVVAWDLAETLESQGCEIVGPAYNLAQAEKLSQEPLDGAVLDVNLGDKKVFPVADVLTKRQIPYCFVTGYGLGGLRPGDLERTVLQKPISSQRIVQAVGALSQS